MKQKKVGVISLGCDKNRVDTEKMLGILREHYELTNELSEAEIVIVNTCAFLECARREAIEEILAADRMRSEGKLEKLVVTGCLPQRFASELEGALTEADLLLGISDYEKLPALIEESYRENRQISAVGGGNCETNAARVLTTPAAYAYLKIADGCCNHCTYCLIPKIRGAYRSVPEAALIEEAAGLGEIPELVLVAQDITRYGEDLTEEKRLPALIRALAALDNIGSIRLLYCYPDCITDELVKTVRDLPKVVKYLDIPLQHADPGVLKRMNRPGSAEEYLALFEKLRSEIPGIALRSTFIAGFPGETEEAFAALCGFLRAAKLDNAGFFAYSREPGTAAAKLPGQILKRVKQKRVRALYDLQRGISRARNAAYVGKTLSVLAEGFDSEALSYVGRCYRQAPEIDGSVFFASSEEVKAGERVRVKITDCGDYDLYGERI